MSVKNIALACALLATLALAACSKENDANSDGTAAESTATAPPPPAIGPIATANTGKTSS